ncbi:MAG TPA: 3-hydroxylacyl-ACP dehydratase [Thermoanaerobaculia bacterium]|jgi:3-hydroxymyristoyl/3-hydroxydecanoyl-(acyl carrier protein) dehydratase|nr:3-hydroxylacyl-ACP dehydratase [Thermoanaerobaculia bacterium]
MPAPEPAPYEVLGSGPEGEGDGAGDGWLLMARIPAASPLFTGHFPGHPILPGVAHLALVTRALSDWQGREVALAGVRSLKLRRPVGPGETLAVRLSSVDGGVGFVLEKDGETVSRGTVSWR